MRLADARSHFGAVQQQPDGNFRAVRVVVAVFSTVFVAPIGFADDVVALGDAGAVRDEESLSKSF